MLPNMSDGDELLRCLAALQRAQAAWLSDLATTCHDADAAFAPAFRRWQEQLAHLQWHPDESGLDVGGATRE